VPGMRRRRPVYAHGKFSDAVSDINNPQHRESPLEGRVPAGGFERIYLRRFGVAMLMGACNRKKEAALHTRASRRGAICLPMRHGLFKGGKQ